MLENTSVICSRGLKWLLNLSGCPTQVGLKQVSKRWASDALHVEVKERREEGGEEGRAEAEGPQGLRRTE